METNKSERQEKLNNNGDDNCHTKGNGEDKTKHDKIRQHTTKQDTT